MGDRDRRSVASVAAAPGVGAGLCNLFPLALYSAGPALRARRGLRDGHGRSASVSGEHGVDAGLGSGRCGLSTLPGRSNEGPGAAGMARRRRRRPSTTWHARLVWGGAGARARTAADHRKIAGEKAPERGVAWSPPRRTSAACQRAPAQGAWTSHRCPPRVNPDPCWPARNPVKPAVGDARSKGPVAAVRDQSNAGMPVRRDGVREGPQRWATPTERY